MAREAEPGKIGKQKPTRRGVMLEPTSAREAFLMASLLREATFKGDSLVHPDNDTQASVRRFVQFADEVTQLANQMLKEERQ